MSQGCEDMYQHAAHEIVKDDYGLVPQVADESGAPQGIFTVTWSHRNLAETGGVRCGAYVASRALSGGIVDAEHADTILPSGENGSVSAYDPATAQFVDTPRRNTNVWWHHPNCVDGRVHYSCETPSTVRAYDRFYDVALPDEHAKRFHEVVVAPPHIGRIAPHWDVR